ncbi:8-amino-7-oxononanoate synthase isoform X2 [Silene latifolia]|uniref:8-amino-7-oxononanoate synthase isoform X2 n=1 Tax=Silene latifolia TaxID=37657 RepID=UPI003D77C582
MVTNWDECVEASLTKLDSLKLLRSLRPINATNSSEFPTFDHAYQSFDGLRQWDRTSVQVQISGSTFRDWLNDIPSCGSSEDPGNIEVNQVGNSCHSGGRTLLLFSGNDYLGLSAHPTIRMAAAKAAQEHGMGPRGSALICGYTDFHRRLEACLAKLKKKEDCLLCPTGFAANMAFMVAVGSVASLLGSGSAPQRTEKVAVFSDALNHASIIDGLRLGERLHTIETFVYRHCDMFHLNSLLSDCKISKKVVVTDSLFSMDGDFAPMLELSKLRKKHGFLLVIDDAHGTFVCGKSGAGVAEMFDCECDVDICIGTLSKAAGCSGGFIACSKMWKQLIMSRGRSFIFSTAMPLPMAAAAHAAAFVAREESWRRIALWERVQDFRTFTGIWITSHIVSIVVGSEEKSLLASRHMLDSGFHVTAIRPPTVPPNSCRLRITLSATHTRKDVRKLAAALSRYINFQDVNHENAEILAKL